MGTSIVHSSDPEKERIQAQHRLEEAQNRDRKAERNARTRRLIQEGAILEKAYPEAREMEMEALQHVLENLWEKLPAYLSGYAASAPGSGQAASVKNNPPVSVPGKPVPNEANPDFSKSTLDMDFIDM